MRNGPSSTRQHPKLLLPGTDSERDPLLGGCGLNEWKYELRRRTKEPLLEIGSGSGEAKSAAKAMQALKKRSKQYSNAHIQSSNRLSKLQAAHAGLSPTANELSRVSVKH